jgi:glycerate kinase
MKIIIAPDSFKGNLTALQAAEHIKQGVLLAAPEATVILVPVADGGEGTVEALVTATNGKVIKCPVHGPLMNKIPAFYGLLGDNKTVVIEMAVAAGLHLVPEPFRNPLHTTTFGVGELIRQALDHGYRRFVIGLGGSSTNDGGIGMAQALGVRFLNRAKGVLPDGQGGKQLIDIADIDLTFLDKRVKEADFLVACDVKNPLYGPTGAAYVYGPQKGATPEIVEALDKGLRHYALVLQKSIKINPGEIPGTGAAGGLGAGLVAFLQAVIKPGIEIVSESVHLSRLLKDADLVITGEGKTDAQTVYGKVPVGIAKVARQYQIPVVCLSGSLESGYESIYREGIDAAFSCINAPMSLQEALDHSGTLLAQSSYAIIRLYQALKTRSSAS